MKSGISLEEKHHYEEDLSLYVHLLHLSNLKEFFKMYFY